MKPLYICTVVFNRHDLLALLLKSLIPSTRQPDGVYVIDHGYDTAKVQKAISDSGYPKEKVHVITLDDPTGAVAGNWFLKNLPDDRIGCGDDIQFYPDTLELMTNTPGDYVIPTGSLQNPGACCMIRQSCVEKVGYFDEKISPGYHYFDDTDYIRRMELAGVVQTPVPTAKVIHHDGGSQSMKAYTEAQMVEHHLRFRTAAANYYRKWGGMPFHETLTVPVEL